LKIVALAVVLLASASVAMAQTYPADVPTVAESGVPGFEAWASPEELAAYIKSETAKWAKVIKEGNIKVE
jgi:tripartite-type tricarboxylate transporter receptor subunit TctC